MAASDFDEVIEQSHLALGEFVKGNPEPLKNIYSHREDVSLANPFGPATRGWKQAAEIMHRAASNYTDGEVTGFENVAKYVTPALVLHCGGRAIQGQGWRKSGYRLDSSASYEHFSA